jgi:hypothetical protein
MSESGPFIVTTEYRRFAEFCDACREYCYIGLCYGPPGVGKTLSARHYTDWNRFEALPSPWDADDASLTALATADAVLYTPEIVNTPSGVRQDINRLCTTLRSLRGEPERRAHASASVADKRAEDQRRFDEMLAIDWMRSPVPVAETKPPPPPARSLPSLAPARLIIVDEADRLRVSSLEQLRDLFDRSEIGLVLIGMPGMESVSPAIHSSIPASALSMQRRTSTASLPSSRSLAAVKSPQSRSGAPKAPDLRAAGGRGILRQASRQPAIPNIIHSAAKGAIIGSAAELFRNWFRRPGF